MGNQNGGQIDGYESTGQSPGLVDIQEMARILSVKVSWLYERSRLGKIPHLKLGKYLRFNPQEVLAFYGQNQGIGGTARCIMGDMTDKGIQP